MSYWRRGHEPGADEPIYGVSSERCHFSWSLLHLEPPPIHCVALEGATMDQLYGELRALSFHRIETRTLTDVSPHRGGHGISVRWPGARCETSDILSSEVVESSQDAFQKALRAFERAYESGRRRAAP